MPHSKKRAAGKAPKAAPPPPAPVEAEPVPAPVPEAEECAEPARPARGMTTEQIRRVGNQIAEHERDLKSNTSRR
jgi:hypothetical protein